MEIIIRFQYGYCVVVDKNASGGDLQKRQQAQAVLEEAERNQTDQYMVALCNVVGNVQNNAQVREIAALQIKNALDARTDRGQEVKMHVIYLLVVSLDNN